MVVVDALVVVMVAVAVVVVTAAASTPCDGRRMAGQVGHTHALRCTPWPRCWKPCGCCYDMEEDVVVDY